MGYVWGLITGILATLALAAAGAAYAYRRLVLLERRARQSERLAELGTLTGGLAHELKNPLSTISLNLQLLREDLPADDPATARIANRIATVQREAARLKDILDDFLRYGGKMELERRPTDLNELCEDLVDFFLPQAQLQRVALRLKTHPEPVIARVDPKLIKQAVLNLLINALQAMNDGGEIMLVVSRRPQWAVIDIIDTGAGIPEEVREMIFVAYYTTKRAGTGLGLAMTRRIVDEHGGRISFKSEIGKGTDFTIQLPLEP
jgi:signal transduction histidine kinase